MDTLLSSLPSMGRGLIGFYFLYFAISNIYHWRPFFNILVEKKIPHPFLLLPIGIAWQSIAGGLIMGGLYVHLAALSLIPFTLISVCIYHDFWNHHADSRRAHLAMFMSNLTVTFGGLFILIGNISPITQWSDLLSP